jgi:hypothetical protein
MPGYRELADIVLQVRRRSDMVNTNFVTDAEIEQYVQDSWGEYIDLMIENGGESLFVTFAQPITTVAGAAYYAIMEQDLSFPLYPDDEGGGDYLSQEPAPLVPEREASIYKTVMVTLKSGASLTELKPSTRALRGRAMESTGRTGRPTEYIVTGPQLSPLTSSSSVAPGRYLMLYPVPDGTYTIDISYISSPPDIGSWLGEYPLVTNFAAWDEYIIVDAAMKCLEKEESDTRHLMARKMALVERIRHHAMNMAHRDGDGIIDVYGDTIDDLDLSRNTG